MPQEQALIFAFVGLIASAIVTMSFKRWRRSKGKTSVFAQDESFEDVGLSALSAAVPSRVTTEDFKTVLRPPWGLRLAAPVLAAVVLIYVDLTPLVDSLGWATEEHAQIAKWITGAVLAYTAAMLLFVQRIAYDGREILSYGVDLRPQRRDLSGLIDIEVHPSRPALVLTFDDQPHLYIPKFLSQRAQFVEKMQAIAAKNVVAGAAPAPRPTLRSRMGL